MRPVEELGEIAKSAFVYPGIPFLAGMASRFGLRALRGGTTVPVPLDVVRIAIPSSSTSCSCPSCRSS